MVDNPVFRFFIVVAFGAAQSLHAQDNEGFVLIKKEGTISLYERWFTSPPNAPIKSREVKVVFYCNNSLAAGLRLIRDEDRAKEWQAHVTEYKIYPSKQDTLTWLEYSYHSVPWPVNDQDHLMEYSLSMQEHGHIYCISFRSLVNEKLAPEREGVTRMHLTGSWTMEQVSENRVKVTYRILSRPIGIPRVFTDPIVRANFMATFHDFIALVENR